MNKGITIFFKLLSQSVLFWAVAMSLFGVFRFYGIGEEDGLQVIPGYEDFNNPGNYLPMFLLTGILIGIMFASVEFLFEKYSSNRIPLGVDLLLKTFVYFLVLVVIGTTIIELASVFFDISKNNDIGWWRADRGFWAFLLYVLSCSVVFSFIKISNEKFGKGVFLKMLLGKYKKPKEEKRIFMFLDLKSSTTIAEELGHYKYSQLIQDCFYDINDVVPKYEAEIYQYVGDEVVLSWPYKKGLANKNCVALYFEFQRLVESRSDYYEEKYGLTPEFKAGLHGGKLMVAEVGIVKKELAFHGDVINTSARIQAECNTHNVGILLSERLKDDLNINEDYKAKAIGRVLLKGKIEEVEIYTLLKV